MPTAPWNKPRLAPVVLVIGPQEYLSSVAVETLRSQAVTANDPDLVTFSAAEYTAGQLAQATSPSLFTDAKFIHITDVEKCVDAFLTDALAYLKDLQPEVNVVLQHGGGNRGKKLITALKKHADCVTIECAALRKEADKVGFVAGLFRKGKRQVSQSAVQALVAAVGSDVRELAAACQQLINDTEAGAQVTDRDVFRYHGGRVEATGFQVADAVVAKNRDVALRLVRQAITSGLNPVPLVAALAARFRTLILVGTARGSAASIAKELGMAPWQVDRARKDLRHWQPGQLQVAMVALADADELVKGGSRDAVYAVEQLVLMLSSTPAR